ncbi:MAG: pilus assembly protein [Rhizobiaceae bacterium]|nr:pilus assembly protein [Rhizobiaceae bacterium]
MKLTSKLLSGFVRSEDGNFAVVMALSAVPLLLGAGMAVDYSRATNNRGNMQNALDAATLSILGLPKTTTEAQRKTKLQEVYVAGGGVGTTSLKTFNIDNLGAATATTSASFDVPTTLMKLAAIEEVKVGVKAGASKPPQLTEANFTLDTVSGWWNKTMYLFGKQYTAGANDPDEKLMQIDYTYNGFGDPKGYGTTTAYEVTIDPKTNKEVKTKVQEEVCTTKKVTKWSNTTGVKLIQQTSGSTKYETTCKTSYYGGDTKGAVIDVSTMDNLYLRMDVTSGTKRTFRSDDMATSEHLFLDGKEVDKNTKVDIFSAVPCGQESAQAWEDGGSALPGPVTAADFFYKVTGKCDYSQKTVGIRLTQ